MSDTTSYQVMSIQLNICKYISEMESEETIILIVMSNLGHTETYPFLLSGGKSS